MPQDDSGDEIRLLYDTPLRDPSNDQLERRAFAEFISRAIRTMDADEGFVFSLQGPWGSGKTTTINFVLDSLGRQSDGGAAVLPVRFNPWWFSGRDQLIQQFFRQFRAVVGAKDLGADLDTAGKHLDRLALLLEPLSYLPTVGEAAKQAKGWFRGAGSSAKNLAATLREDVHGVRSAIDEALRKSERRFLIVIDDIDRLPADEVRQVFQLVKAVADFPKTIYLLAFDRRVVVRALEQLQPGFGDDYLSKIVQAPLDLPSPDPGALRRLLFEQLDSVLHDTPEHLFDSVAWGNVFFDGIAHFIRTPRDVKRLINGLRPTYPQVRSEVSGHEFVAIQTLRVFAPEFYAAVAASKASLSGVSAGSFERDDREGRRQAFDQMLGLAPTDQREATSGMMSRLFPRWANAYGGPSHGSDWLARWRREGRACSPEVFDLYFHLVISASSMSQQEVRRLLERAADPVRFRESLSELADQRTPDGISRARLFLEAVQDYTEDQIPVEHVGSVIGALFDVGDSLVIKTDERGMFSIGNDMQIARVTYQLLSRLPDSQARFEILRAAFTEGASIEIPAHEVSLLEDRRQSEGEAEQPESARDRQLDPEHVEQLRTIALDKIRAASTSGVLRSLPNLAYVLYRWKEWAGNEPIDYGQVLVAEDQGFAVLVEAFLRKTQSHALDDRVGRTTDRVSVEGLREFSSLDDHSLVARARAILTAQPEWLSPDQALAMKVVIREIEEPLDDFGRPR